MRRFRGLLSDGLFGTLSRRLLVRFVDCVTGRAAQDGASEATVGELAGDIAGNWAPLMQPLATAVLEAEL
jgi:hypothetical protein